MLDPDDKTSSLIETMSPDAVARRTNFKFMMKVPCYKLSNSTVPTFGMVFSYMLGRI